MTTPEMLDFIKREQEKGVSKESITRILLVEDWTEKDVEEAYAIISPPNSQIGT